MSLNTFARAGLALLVAALPAPASAQSPERADTGAWQSRLTPYLWGAGLEGTVGALGRRARIDQGFGDILDDLELGGMLGFEARRDRVGLLGDVLHVRLGESGRMVAPPGVPVSATARTRTTTALLAAQYRVADDERGSVDVLGGLRHWSLHADVRLGPPIGLGERSDERWTDPVVGVKGLYRLGPRSYATGWAMVGGFDVGARSSSDLMLALGYTLNPRTAVLLAYRRLAVDYRDNGLVFDTVQRGPAIGLDYRF